MPGARRPLEIAKGEAPLPRHSDAVRAGTRLGKYEILDKIGDGGMGAVYRAQLRAQLAAGEAARGKHAVKPVALKLIHPHLSATGDFSLMFLDEVRLAMSMAHRNIVQTFDAGSVGEQHYMVMELVDGCSLRRLLDTTSTSHRRLALDTALFIGAELCAALDYAHRFTRSGDRQRGVVHRDVSPSNVLLSSHGEVKLADFGVAKAAGRLSVTHADVIKGKLAYMAPEQARGIVSPRSDLFAVGALLFEMCCGQPIRRGATLEGVRAGSAVADPRRLRPELSASLATLLQRCLAVDPEQRPAGAGALREQLEDEAFRLEVKSGQRTDRRAALGRLVHEARTGAGRHRGKVDRDTATAERAADQPAGRVAAAMLEHALAVPTDHGDEPSVSASVSASLTPPTTPRGLPEDRTAPGPLEPNPTGETTALLAADPLAPEPTEEEPLSAGVEGGPRLAAIAALVACGAIVAAAAAWMLARDSGDRRPPRATRPAARGRAVEASTARRADAAGAPAPGAASAEHADAVTPPDLALPSPDSRPIAPPAAQRTVGVDRASGGARPARRRRTRRKHHRKRAARRRGRLDINATPWARVYVDGRYRGQTPVQSIRLAAGNHRVRLVNAQLRLTRTVTIHIRPGQHVRRLVQLRRRRRDPTPSP